MSKNNISLSDLGHKEVVIQGNDLNCKVHLNIITMTHGKFVCLIMFDRSIKLPISGSLQQNTLQILCAVKNIFGYALYQWLPRAMCP